MSRFSMSVNITPVERVGRLVVGLAAIVGAVVLLRGADGALAVALLVLLGLAGLDLGRREEAGLRPEHDASRVVSSPGS